MRKLFIAMTPVLSLLLGVSAFGQDPPPPQVPRQAAGAQAPAPVSPCPRVEVQSSAARGVHEGQTVTFAANIQGGDPKVAPQLIWQVNSGMIKTGQQTRKIEVDTAGAGAYGGITADLWVGGYSGECATQASGSVRVVPPASKADEFGDLEQAKENERLRHLATALAPTDYHYYIIAYAGRTSPRGHAVAGLRRMRDALVADGFDAGRIVVLDGGFREQAAYELWAVPNGALPPKPSPTVDRREIVYPRTTAPARRRTKP